MRPSSPRFSRGEASTPSGAGTVSAADSILSALQKINGNVALAAPLASPAFTGTPTAPTATVGTNTTQVATTAFVIANAGSGGAVSSVTAGCGLTISPTTGAVVASTNVTTTNNTATTDTIANTQCGTIITENNAAIHRGRHHDDRLRHGETISPSRTSALVLPHTRLRQVLLMAGLRWFVAKTKAPIFILTARITRRLPVVAGLTLAARRERLALRRLHRVLVQRL